MIFALADLLLLLLCGVIALRLPARPSEPLPEGGLTSAAMGIGIVAMVRGVWRLVTVIPMLVMLSDSDSESPTLLNIYVGVALASMVVGFLTGLLIAQHKISERSTSPFVKDTLGEIASFVWPARQVLAIGALVCAAAQLAPHAMMH